MSIENKENKIQTSNILKDKKIIGFNNYNTNKRKIQVIKNPKTIKINRTNRQNYKNIILLLYLICFSLYLSKELNGNRKLTTTVSKIVLTISGTGTQSILSDEFSSLPSEIYINGEQKTSITNKYTLTSSESTIILKWNSLLTTCSKMFYDLSNIIKIDLSEFISTNVIDMSYMFYKCSNIKEINLSNLNTESVTSMDDMFYECDALTSLDLSNFNTLKVTSMQFMFYECNSLLSLDLSSFNTPSLTTTYFMFNDCDKLISIDLSNFITSKVNNMQNMFGWCVSLISVDLSQFDTSLVTNMMSMFLRCRKLLFVNLKFFSENNNLIFDSIFEEVPSDLIYCINGQNAPNILSMINTISSINDCSNICFQKSIKVDIDKRICIEEKPQCSYFLYNDTCYEECPKRTKISADNPNLCLDLICNNYYNYNQNDCIDIIEDGYFVNDTTIKTIDKCHEDCKTCEKKGSLNNSNCKTCPSNKFYDNGNCSFSCVNGYYTDSLNNKICKCSSKIKCKNCTDESIKYDLCITCNDGYYQKEEDSSNIYPFINCYNNLEGYYLKNNIYKRCYPNCKKCNEYGDENENKCIECIDNFILINDSEITTNCYEKCKYYYYFDSSKKYHCTIDNKCPDDYNKLNKDKNKCLNDCRNDKENKYDYNNICYKICPEGTIPNNYICEVKNMNDSDISECTPLKLFNNLCNTHNKNSTYKDNMIIEIQTGISNYNNSLFYLQKNDGNYKDLLVKENDISYHITTSINQNISENKGISIILLGHCENILREKYNITYNIPLLLFIIEKYDERLFIPIIEYEIYNYKTREKLDLHYCRNSKINILIPVNIDNNILFMHNVSSPYYNDPCNQFTTKYGSDIILKDRRNEYQENYMGLCEKNCELVEYNYITKKVNCECEIKTTFTLFSNIIIDKNKLLNKFTDIKTSANINVIPCYKILFTKEGLKDNIGSYIILSIIFIYIISLILFLIRGFKIFYNIVKRIISNIKQGKNTIEKKKNKNNSKIIKSNKKVKHKKKKIIKSDHQNSPNKKKKKIKNKKKLKNINILLTNNNIINISNDKINSKSIIKTSNKNLFNNNITEIQKQKLNSKNNVNFILKLNDYELNNLSYIDALKYDKRNYLKYYLSLLRTKHAIIFTFCTHNDFNSIIIKICLFFFSIGLYITVTTLFFNDSTMHKIYEDEGIFDFIYQIPKILYSTLITSTISTFIKFLSLSESNIIELKNQKINLEIKSNNILKCLKIKFFFFFFFSFLLLFVFWYYVSVFCAVYENTQFYLMKDVLISFVLSLLYPFVLNLFPGIFRIISLKSRDRNKEYLYKISKIIQKI